MRLMALRGVERAQVPETLLMVEISLGGRDVDQFVRLGPHSPT